MIAESKKTYKSFLYILFLVLNASLGSFSVGYKIGEMNFLVADLQHLYSWSSAETSVYTGLLNAMLPIGAIAGAILSGNYFMKLGRRWGMISADLIGIIGSLICIFIGSTPYPQIIGRFISGIAVGMNCLLVPLYINEMAPMEISGFMGSFFQFILLFGTMSSYLMGLGIPDDSSNYNVESSWWICVFLLPVVTYVIRMVLLLIYYRFDTPFSLIKLKKEEEVAKVIKKIYKLEFIKETIEKIDAKMNSYHEVSYKELFTVYRLRLFLGIMMMVAQKLSGINAVMAESSTLYATIDNSSEMRVFTIINSVILLIAALVSGLISDKFGRRILILCGNGACIIFLFLMGVFMLFSSNDMQKFSIYLTFLFLFSFGVSLGPVAWLYNPEILPDKAIRLAVIVNMFLYGLVVLLTPIVIESVGICAIYFFFAGVATICEVFFYFAMKETRGKSGSEIDKMFGTNVRKEEKSKIDDLYGELMGKKRNFFI